MNEQANRLTINRGEEMMSDLKDAVLASQSVALAGIKSGQEIGRRESAAKIAELRAALQEIADWGMHSGTAAYQKGEHDPAGYYSNAYYLMEAEISKARELARAAIAKVTA